ncbi:hypothetical protein L1049_001961 [Liquidambar formosana]|uniref:Pentatricopeptide repeat-containing protein n=1 Tax=Liquidambar formosana TaxID=63359 RepID=A0AAP0NIA5_LIQFO
MYLDSDSSLMETSVAPSVASPLDFYTSVLQASLKSKDPFAGKSIHARIIKAGLHFSAFLMNNLINFYAKTGFVSNACHVFDEIPVRNTYSWSTILSAYAKQGRIDTAHCIFEEMPDRDSVSWTTMIMGYNQMGRFENAIQIVPPTQFTITNVLASCVAIEALDIGRKVHSFVVKLGLSSYIPVANSLLNMYAKLGDPMLAKIVFDRRMRLKSISSRNNGFNNDAIQLFRLMVIKGPKLNCYTLVAVLSVSSSLASLDHGKQIHANAIKSGEESSVSVSNALITMYAKVGSINGARRVFNVIHWNRDTVSWSSWISMIIALGQHGLGEEAIELFEKMLAVSTKPNHITYVGVLSACTHVGLVDQGGSYFNLMQYVHKIEPTQSHYACMIDLFGYAGLLQEAQDFIVNKRIEVDVIAWDSLLASCKLDNSGAYSALANMYSAGGKWDDAAKIRKSMKDRGVKKDLGFSWVQIKNKVHIFGAEDGLHPQKDAIYETIPKIWKEIKKMGFIPDTEAVFT